MELLSSSCAPTESPLKELNIGFAPIVLNKSKGPQKIEGRPAKP